MIGAQHSNRYSKNLPVVPQHLLVASTGALLIVCDNRVPAMTPFERKVTPKASVTLNAVLDLASGEPPATVTR